MKLLDFIKKKKARAIIVLFTLCFSVNFGFAQDEAWFVVDNLHYYYDGNSENNVLLEWRDEAFSPTVFEFPSTVTYEGTTYNVTRINGGVFYGCTSLTNASIPASVREIYGNPFAYCPNLAVITVANDNPAFSDFGNNMIVRNEDNCIIAGCNGTNFANIPTTIESIGNEAFAGSLISGSITIPNNITNIMSGAFYKCENITSVTLPSQITTIAWGTFNFCTSLASINIPVSVSEIEGNPFAYCPALTTITVDSGNTVFRSDNNNMIVRNENNWIIAGCKGTNFASISTNTYEAIGDEAFTGSGIVGNIIIPNGITYIGIHAFCDCVNITGVSLPGSLTTIQSSSFEGCTNMVSVYIPASVTTIEDRAFHGSGLTSVNIPVSVVEIGLNPFMYCDNLETITVDSQNPAYIGVDNMIISKNAQSSVMIGCKGTSFAQDVFPYDITRIGDSSFEGMITDPLPFNLPVWITDIGANAFAGCTGFTGNLDTKNVHNIGDGAFIECTGFSTTLNIPYVYSIGNMAFAYCENLTVLGSTNPNLLQIGVDAFYGSGLYDAGSDGIVYLGDYCLGYDRDEGQLSGEIELKSTTVYIAKNAFEGCDGLTGELVIPASVKKIDEYAFGACHGLTTLTFEANSSLEQICEGAFRECGFTNRLIIPNSVRYIFQCAFAACSGFSGLSFEAGGNLSLEIYDYAFAECTGFEGGLTIADRVIEIRQYAFYGCTGFDDALVIGNDVKKICSSAFEGCTGFVSLEFADEGSLTEIDDMAFYNCSGFRGNLVIPNSVTIIGYMAFVGTGFNGDLVIGNSVETIRSNAFENCTGFTSLSFADESHLKTIYVSAFQGCTGLQGDLTIPNSVEFIDLYAFYGCTGMTGALVIGNSVQTISDWAFENCGFSSLSFVENSHLVSLYNPFQNCTNLSSITISDSQYMTNVSVEGFYNTAWYNNHPDGILYLEDSSGDIKWCMGYKGAEPTGTLHLDDETLVIAGSAFANCSELTNIEMPNTIITIGGGAFIESGLAGELTLPESLVNIGGYAFRDCVGLTGDLILPDPLVSVGMMAFADCSGLTGILVIPMGVSELEDGAFVYCGFEKIVAMPQTPPGDHDYFEGLDPNTKVYIPKAVNLDPGQTYFPMDFPNPDNYVKSSFFIGGNDNISWDYSTLGKNNWAYLAAPTANDPVFIMSDCNLTSTKEIVELHILKASTLTVKKAAAKDGSSNVFTVNGDIYCYGDDSKLVLEDGAQLINSNDDVVATVKKDIAASASGEYNWYLLSLPQDASVAPTSVANMLEGGVYGTDYALYKFDQTQDLEWINWMDSDQGNYNLVNDAENNIVEGYLYANTNNVTLEFTGNEDAYLVPSDAQVVIDLSYSPTLNPLAPFNGWNLVGNPYPCNLSNIANKTLASEPFTAFYTVDGAAELVAGTFATDDIKPCQGFFVDISDLEDDAQLVLNAPASKGDNMTEKMPVIAIEAGNNAFIDKAFVQIGEGNTLHKMTLSDNTAKMYLKYANKDYAAITIKEADGVIPVYFEAPELGNYTISAKPTNVEFDYLHLIDNQLGKDVDMLLENEYGFVASKNDSPDRFRLVFRGATDVEEITEENDSFAYFDGNDIVVANEGIATLEAYDVMGRMIANRTINGAETISTSSMQTGVYVLRLTNGSDVKTQKIVVR